MAPSHDSPLIEPGAGAVGDRQAVTQPYSIAEQTAVVSSSAVEPSSVGPMAPSHDSPLIEPGARVRVEGLISRTELNGQEGRVVAWDTGESRWRVALSSGQGICAKPSNLVVLPASDLAAERPERRIKYGPPPPPPA